MDRYIGLDVHASSCTFSIINARGKHLGSQVVGTNGQSLISFIKTIPGAVHPCMEECTQSAWLAEILSPKHRRFKQRFLDAAKVSRTRRAPEFRPGGSNPIKSGVC